MDYKDLLKNEEVKELLKKGNANLGVLGYTDHSEAHCAIVAERAGIIFAKNLAIPLVGFELAQMAGAFHDIGNAINRKNHGEYGALLAYSILEKMKVPLADRVAIASAIGKLMTSRQGEL